MRCLLMALVFAGSWLASGAANAQQKQQPMLEQRQTVEQAFTRFAEWVRSKQAKEVLNKKLTSDPALRCAFWGSECQGRASATCALSSVLQRSTLSTKYGKPCLFKSHWQIEVTLKGSLDECKQDFPLIFQLENGFRRIVALPYT